MYHLRYGGLGPHRLDRVNLKQAAAIIIIFGIITIISYFNELAKQGLLTGKAYRYYPQHQFDLASETAHIKRGDQKIDLDLAHLKSVLKVNTSRKARSADDTGKINIALHLGRNNSYESSHHSAVKIVIYKNVMSNFFNNLNTQTNNSQSRLSEKLLFISDNCVNVNSTDIRINNKTKKVKESLTTMIRQKLCEQEKRTFAKQQKEVQARESVKLLKNYTDAVKVFVYQHEVSSYTLRDCFKKLTRRANLNLLNVPLNHALRQEWEIVPQKKRDKYDALFGSLSFGVCENIQRPCLYTTMLAHPLDRILQVYFQCRQNFSNNMCNFYKNFNATHGDLHSFIKATGSSFFKKLIYYSKQCRLIGDDEICIQDNKATFILTPKERHIYLDNVLNNLNKWFGVVGLADKYNESLQLFEYVTGLNFTTCPVISQNIVPKKYKQLVKSSQDNSKVEILYENLVQLKQKLLNDSQVIQWLYADLAIYNKIESLFKEQWETFQKLLPDSKKNTEVLRHVSEVNKSKNTIHSDKVEGKLNSTRPVKLHILKGKSRIHYTEDKVALTEKELNKTDDKDLKHPGINLNNHDRKLDIVKQNIKPKRNTQEQISQLLHSVRGTIPEHIYKNVTIKYTSVDHETKMLSLNLHNATGNQNNLKFRKENISLGVHKKVKKSNKSKLKNVNVL